MDYSHPGSSVHGILQAKTLDWAAMSSSRGSSGIEPECLISAAMADKFFTTRATWEAQLWLILAK